MAVALLLPMNGADNGTVFTDYSPTPKTITRYGDTKTVAAQSKYYGSSGYFDGSGDYLSVAYHADLEIGTGPYTFRAWFRPTAITAARTFMSRSSPTSGITRESAFYLTSATNFNLYYGVRGYNQTLRSFTLPTITTGVWHHIEHSRDTAGVMRTFLDGVASANTYTDSTSLSGGGVLPLDVGSFFGAQNPFYGYLQDMELRVGEALHTANFTPPAMLLSPISGTIRDTAGTPCARTVHLFDRASGTKLGTTVSDASTGQYALYAPPGGNEVIRVVLADEATLYNDITDRIVPA